MKSFDKSKAKKAKKSVPRAYYILDDKSDFKMVEAFKSIRTNIMFSLPKSGKGKVIGITSAAPAEGKTTTCVNLAITFAQMGAKVLIIDCDLRKPQVHRCLKLSRKEGITNVLCGFNEFENVVQRSVQPNMDCLLCGEIPPNPAELLETSEFGELIDYLKSVYDYIFVDTPPINVVTDASVITKHCSGLVLVIRQNYTTYDFLDTAMQSIKRTGTMLLGAIMVGTDDNSRRYNYYKKNKGYYKQLNYRYAQDSNEP